MAPLDPIAPYRDLYPFAPHYLETPSGRLHYVDEGPANAPVLLCVHGNPSWSFLYRQVIGAFAPQMRVIAPDHLGCGLSDQPRPGKFGYRLTDHVALLSRLIESLDLQRVTLLVHDWGGPIGTLALLRHPERFERLVITNTALFPSTAIPTRIAICRGPLGRLAVEGLGAFALAATHLATTRPLPKRVRSALRAPYRSPRSARATWRFVDDIPLAPSHPSYPALAALGAALPRLDRLPTLLLWGERDWCFTTAFRDELRRRLPHARSIGLADAGHYLFEDRPEAVNRAIAQHLRP